jgi:hypothetical protein
MPGFIQKDLLDIDCVENKFNFIGSSDFAYFFKDNI